MTLNSQFRASLIAAAVGGCALCWILAPPQSLRAGDAARITDKAVWNPSSSELSEIRRKCSEGDPAQHEACFIDSLKSAGASAEAMAFVKEFAPSNGLAYIRGFRNTGRVDIAYIEYLFRANDLDGVLLVNGTPPLIDVDDDKYLSRSILSKSTDYVSFLRENPNANVFPADRYHTNLPTESSPANGRQAFEVEYLLLDGCHACARIGTLVVAFNFESGRFLDARVAEVRSGGDNDRPALSKRGDREDAIPKEASVNPGEIQAKAGASFTITLAANHTTGYSWRLAKPLDPELLKQISDIYEEDSSGRTGAGGKEKWTFDALRAGTAEIDFEYARPWEKDAAPVNTAKYRVTIK